MKHFKYLSGIITTLLVCGCSSPPPPPAVDWDAQNNEINTTIPSWGENSVVVSTPTPSGNWSYIVANFQEDGGDYPMAFYYSIVHAKEITISSQSPTQFFKTKLWLQQHGAKGLVTYSSKSHCLICHSTDIYLSR